MISICFSLISNQQYIRHRSTVLEAFLWIRSYFQNQFNETIRLLKNKFFCEFNFFKKIIKFDGNLKKIKLVAFILFSFVISAYNNLFFGALLGLLLGALSTANKRKKITPVPFVQFIRLLAVVLYFFLSIVYSVYSCYKTVVCLFVAIYYTSKFFFLIFFLIFFLFTHGFVVTWLVEAHSVFWKNTGQMSFLPPKHRIVIVGTYFMYFPAVFYKTFIKCTQAIFNIQFIKTLIECARRARLDKHEDKLKKVVFTRRNMHRNLFIYRFLYLVLCEYFTLAYRRRWAAHVKKYFDLIIRLWTLRAYDAVTPFFISILAILLELSFISVIFLFFSLCVQVIKDFNAWARQVVKNIRHEPHKFFKKTHYFKNVSVPTSLLFVVKKYYKYLINLISFKYLKTAKRERFLAVRVRYFIINNTTILQREIEYKGSYATNKNIVNYVRSLLWMFLRLSFFRNLNKSCYRFIKKTPMHTLYGTLLPAFIFVVFVQSLKLTLGKIYALKLALNFFIFLFVNATVAYCSATAFFGVYKSAQTKHIRFWSIFYANKWQHVKAEYPNCIFCFFFCVCSLLYGFSFKCYLSLFFVKI